MCVCVCIYVCIYTYISVNLHGPDNVCHHVMLRSPGKRNVSEKLCKTHFRLKAFCPNTIYFL